MERIRPLLLILVLAGVLTPTPAFAVYKICIDPGHGGSDPGAVGCGMEEADNTLDVGWRIHALMTADGDLTPIMTRTSDVYVSLAGRVSYANDNGADRFASIHNNAFNGNATGIETFCYSNGSAQSFDQRDRIQDGMTSIWPALADRGGKTAQFYVIKYTNMPSTLSELAFIDNCSIDATYLSDPDEAQAAAVVHHQAIRQSLGLGGTIPDPGPDPVGTGIVRGTVFQDLGVGTDDMSVRIPGAAVHADGGGNSGSDVASQPDADWMISVPAGTYTISASAAGYHDNSRVCTVASGQTAWCSVGLFVKEVDPPPPEDGVLRGFVFEDQGAGDQDMSKLLPGSMVTIEGNGEVDMVTAGTPDAGWQFSVAPGSWTVKASSPGYWMNTRVCEVVAGAETWCSVGLFSVEEDPPIDVEPPEDGPQGVLLGAVFVEQGSGTGDMSIRLAGASVKAVGVTGTETAVTDGEWGLYDMQLPPGTYEVTAALDGYWPNTRICEVVVGGETWCSLGLWSEDESPPGEEPDPPVDEPDPDPGDDPLVPEDPLLDPMDPATPANPLGGDPIAGDDLGGSGGCGMATTPASSSGLLLLGLLLLLFLRRSTRSCGRAVHGPMWILLLLFSASPAVADEAPGLRLTDVHPVSDARGCEQPVWSPDGARLAFGASRLSELRIVTLKTGDEALVATGASVGYEPVWSPEGDRIEHRHKGQRSCDVPVASVRLDGTCGAAPVNRHPGRWVRVRDDQVHLRTGRIERRLSPEGDRYCCAAMAPGGAAVAFMGLATGIHVHDVAAARTYALGPGAHPRFSADGAALVFDRCEDDGEVVTSCTLWRADLHGDAPVLHEIHGAHPMARHPALSPDGAELAYDADGRIWIGRLE